MKKILFIFLTGILCTSIAFAGFGFSPKKIACDKTCKEALKKCKKKADGNQVKITACDVANKKCLKKCKKECK